MAFFGEKNLYGFHFELYPELEKFINETKTLREEEFWGMFRPFKHLAHSNFIPKLIGNECQKIAELFDYDQINQDVGIDIIKLPHYTLTLGKLFENSFIDGNRPEVVGFASDMMFYNLGPGTLEVEIYEVSINQNLDIFDKRKKPTLKSKAVQNVGDIITLKAGREIIKITKLNDIAYQLYLVSSKVQNLVWHYDENTLEPKYATAGKSQSSRLQCAMMILAELGSTRALPYIKELTKSNEHFLRWDAVKVLLALNPEEGKPYLEKALKDPHPHVRCAAKSTLSIFHKLCA